jgi:hypothetical protein
MDCLLCGREAPCLRKRPLCLRAATRSISDAVGRWTRNLRAGNRSPSLPAAPTNAGLWGKYREHHHVPIFSAFVRNNPTRMSRHITKFEVEEESGLDALSSLEPHPIIPSSRSRCCKTPFLSMCPLDLTGGEPSVETGLSSGPPSPNIVYQHGL